MSFIEETTAGKTAAEIRSITVEQIFTTLDDGSMTIVQAENIRLQLLAVAQVREVSELKQSFLNILEDSLAASFPNAVIEGGSKNGYPYVTVWPKGKWQEIDDDE